MEKAELAAYQLRDVAQISNEQYKDSRPVVETQYVGKGSMRYSLIGFFP